MRKMQGKPGKSGQNRGGEGMNKDIIDFLKKYTDGKRNTERVEISVIQLNRVIKALEQQSEDAISSQAVLDLVNSDWKYEGLETDVASLPPVTPRPKMGHWIYYNFNWWCSECNETPKTMGYVGTADFMKEHFKFCNHCGARMIDVPDINDGKLSEILTGSKPQGSEE